MKLYVKYTSIKLENLTTNKLRIDCEDEWRALSQLDKLLDKLYYGASLVAQLVNNLPAIQEIQV